MKSPLELLPNTYRAFFGHFPSLTHAQKTIIQPILQGRDVVLQSGTGSGKTEAVLAPATENLMTHQGEEYTIVYIVPTRALALDMNRRIKPLFRQLGLKAGIRTGDGKSLWGAKPDLLITTPESLDVLLGSDNQENKHFLKHVHVMIIDEVHVFSHNERGRHLSHLRQRLNMQSLAPLQTLALSATIGDTSDIAKLLNLKQKPYAFQEPPSRQLQPCWVYLENQEQELPQFFDDLYRHWGCKKILFFANTRKKCEELYDLLKQDCLFSQTLLLHYSNLSTKERRFIESSFRKRKLGVCIATTTLELGIDIGDVDGVVLMGPPSSSMAFLQRIGRGNRRRKLNHFWGICQGANAQRQLIRFLAIHELAKENQVEKQPSFESYSVLFQQILSCLYAKKRLSKMSMERLFTEQPQAIKDLFQHMISNKWLRQTKQPGLYDGGWRYYTARKKQQIWSNFPPTEEEYDVILEKEKIATLPLAIVKQLEPGVLIQLTGRTLKILQIEEKELAREVLTEKSNGIATKELLWAGFGAPISFEVAQKMKEILINRSEYPGLLKRSHHLLETARNNFDCSIEQPNSMRTYKLSAGTYRYETFLGTVGNFILYHLVKAQFEPVIEGLSVDFDELGIETNEKIPFHLLKIPHTEQNFKKWISAHLRLLSASFSWNSWLHWLPEEYKQKEICSRLNDSRIFEAFYRYHSETKWLPFPERSEGLDKTMASRFIELKGEPWSLDKEKNAWGRLSFPTVPPHNPNGKIPLTATLLQGYVTQKLCARWARFQQLNYKIKQHPRFKEKEQAMHSRRQQGIAFKQRINKELQNEYRVVWETKQFSLEEAIQDVINRQTALFLARAKLKIKGGLLKGSPDLIYIKHQENGICLEVWDIKYSQSVSYAQKWRVAFYAHLLEQMLQEKTFSLPVKVSDLGGLVHPPFEKTPFLLTPYRTWLPRLLVQWESDSTRCTALQEYSIERSCDSCCYFSYCYQENLFKVLAPLENKMIISRDCESNDFPKNTKQWFFIHYDRETIQWQVWENGEAESESRLYLHEFSSSEAFLKEAAERLYIKWSHAINNKNPHFLVYDPEQWYLFQTAFQSTKLKSVWMMHTCWSAIQNVLNTHFSWPVHGRLSATQVAACLGISDHVSLPLSLYHRQPCEDPHFEIYKKIWNWCLAKVKSRRTVFFEHSNRHSPLIDAYLHIHRREAECRTSEILEFQKRLLSERIEQFRSIGPIRISSRNPNNFYTFSFDKKAAVAKFRSGDFLKLSPIESTDIQEGFSVILNTYEPSNGTLSVRPLFQKMRLSKNVQYALDENATDWNAPKIERVLTLLKDPNFRPEITKMLLGQIKCFAKNSTNWAEQWYESRASEARLNSKQKAAFLLPFREKISLIEGPPGTGKTHLLVWTLIALVAHAQAHNRSIKILVTAQTHHAIDQILLKMSDTLPSASVPYVPLLKYGRYDDQQMAKQGIRKMKDSALLINNESLILGATGFGVYQLLEKKHFPQLFDWVIFDESSQMLVPTALVSLIFGKGNALFYGDTQQLSPVLIENYASTSLVPRSILQELIARSAPQNRLRLEETYRMNTDICQYVSKHWYDGQLYTAVPEKKQKLSLLNYPVYQDRLDDYLNPSQSLSIVQLDHTECQQSSQEEANWIAQAIKRLTEDYAHPSTEIGIISPHRLQNNTILAALKETLPFSLQLPRVDTVERMQGREFDVVIFSATVSDKKIIHSPFLKEYRRFNVALTRARKKFIFVASPLFFSVFPSNENALLAQLPFENFYAEKGVI